MATFGTRLFTTFRNGVWIKANGHKAETGAPGAANNAGTRDMVRLVVQRSPNQTSDMVQVVDQSKNLLAGVDNLGNLYRSGVPTMKDCTSMVAISSANITGTAAGQLGNASGVVLVPDPAAGSLIELVSVILSFTYSTAAYTGGGNITVNSDGGSALTGLVSAANSLGASANKIVQFVPLSTVGNALVSAKGLNLVAASAFTQPGTAAGTVIVYCNYRVYSSL